MTGPEDPLGATTPTPTPTAGDAPAPQRLSRYLMAIGLVVMLAGLLFGYDQGVISGALSGIDKSFHPGTLVIEIITSWVTLGAGVGVASVAAPLYGAENAPVARAAGPVRLPLPDGDHRRHLPGLLRRLPPRERQRVARHARGLGHPGRAPDGGRVASRGFGAVVPEDGPAGRSGGRPQEGRSGRRRGGGSRASRRGH